jgi:hypothetical protein
MEIPGKIWRIAASLGLCGTFGSVGCSESKASTATVATRDAAACEPTTCTAQLRGNVSDLVALAEDCGTLGVAPDAGSEGTYLLAFHGSSAQIASADVTVYLGATPTPGTVSPQSVTQWSASVKSSLTPGCELRAGSSSVPMGSFTLSLSSVNLSSGDAGNGGSAHGSLNATLYVHAPPDTDCGAGEIEDIAIAF